MINVVTGNPRSGTSLCMNILQKIGVDTIGNERFQKANNIDSESQKEHKYNLNPDGLNEVNGITVKGIPPNMKWNKNIINKTIKIVFGGMFKTNAKYIKGGIICLRNPLSICESQQHLCSNVSVVDEKKNDWVYPERQFSPIQPFFEINLFYHYLQQTDLYTKFSIIWYEDWFADPDKNINIIEKQFKVLLSEDQRKDIKAMIKPGLYRSKTIDQWPDEYKDIGNQFHKIQDLITESNFDDVDSISDDFNRLVKPFKLKNARWVDDELTGVTVNAEVWNKIQTDEVFKQKMMDSMVQRRLNQPSLVFVDCPYYSRETTEEYTIERIPELGDLTRKKVKCGKYEECRTVEACKQCWVWGYNKKSPECYNHKNKHLEDDET